MVNQTSPSSRAQLFVLLEEIVRALRQQAQAVRSELGDLTHLQLHALFLLRSHGDLRMSDLAEELHISAPSATALIDRLTEGSWVLRQTDRTDRRSVSLALSPRATKLLDDFHRQKTSRLAALLDVLPDDDIAHLTRILTKLHAASHKESYVR